jgi:predicted TIM-barrel fold metal-dependent hydrolase
VFATFWFEVTTLPLLELFPDNVMFETDYPHPTSLSPGPASASRVPSEHIDVAFAGLSPETRRKVLHDTAARVYHLA